LIYLEHAYAEMQEQRATEGQPFTRDDLYAAITAGAGGGGPPKKKTGLALLNPGFPLLWRHRTRGGGKHRVHPPAVWRECSPPLLTLIVIPSIYAVVKGIVIRSPRLAPTLQQT